MIEVSDLEPSLYHLPSWAPIQDIPSEVPAREMKSEALGLNPSSEDNSD